MDYSAPIENARACLHDIVGFDRLIGEGNAWSDLSAEDVESILREAGRFSSEILAPLNASGDKEGSRLENGVVRTPSGFKEAYQQFVDSGWGSLAFNPDYGGQGLPRTLNAPVLEFLQAANMAFALCPMLTVGAVELLDAHGAPEQKDLYLSKLISGEWTGAMCLTEPQAGSDLGAVRTKARPNGDGTYSIEGQKIYITWGEHDVADNIVHLVLARLPGGLEGSTRGLSLFLVPKFPVKPDGSLGPRNDWRCTGLEHKLGIHASPTCTIQYGESGQCVGWLVGEENKGLKAMFTMMNNARLNVGLQGVGIAERAYQQALSFARDRRQGKPYGLQHEMRDMIPVIEHLDVRRMLATSKAKIEASRAICYANAMAIDMAGTAGSEAEEMFWRGREELLTPLAKAWSTDVGVEVAGTGIQIHGGMGYVEETGAAQHLRDARIAPIYEGTNGIQAVDLATRKLLMDGGHSVAAMLDEARETVDALGEAGDLELDHIGFALREVIKGADEATDAMVERLNGSHRDNLAAATPYLRMMGAALGAHFLGRGALAAAKRREDSEEPAPHLDSRIHLARFFAEEVAPVYAGEAQAVMAGSGTLQALDGEALATN